ncbi:Uncharacterised protein [Salmonella enterica subsp. enterica]|uniref:Uncharacterized protein n=1 Tax=Salmonella enterica I TaxID=59201 RepID=A0A3S4IHH8_SALET|nr:Uncharacterised protein [Salmonella enterica subsp. enterica]
MRLASAGQHFAAAGARIVIDLLRRWAEMRFGVKALILRRQVDAGGFNYAQTAPLAVAINAEHIGDGLLRQHVSGIRHHATVLVFNLA